MDKISKTQDSQLLLLTQLVDQVERVKKSSNRIANFVNTVESIASQTGLLAMNASIEAAHAGTLGKGFSVIAQEIRKLSEQTTKNALEISDTLKENEAIVNETSEAMSSFSKITKESSVELNSTIHSIEEILAGISEMDVGTQDVIKSLQIIVEESHINKDLTENVVNEISEQNKALTHISTFANTVEERVSSLDGLLTNIKIAIANIKKEATKNTEVSKKISESLDSQ